MKHLQTTWIDQVRAFCQSLEGGNLTKTASISSSLKCRTRGFHILVGACQNSVKAPVSSLRGFDADCELELALEWDEEDEGEDEDWNLFRKSAKCSLYSGGAAGCACGGSGSR